MSQGWGNWRPLCRNPFWSQVRSGQKEELINAAKLARGRNPFWSQVRSGLVDSFQKRLTLLVVVIPSGVRSGQANPAYQINRGNIKVVIPSGVRSGQAS